MNLSRRAVLKISLLASGLLTLGGLIKYLSYEEPPQFLTRMTLETPEAYSPGSITPVPQVRAWLIHDDDGLYAVSGECTHLGCIVAYQGENVFECPCHGSRFDLNGRVLAGPANSPLRHVELSRSPDGSLVIDTQIVVPSNQRLELAES